MESLSVVAIFAAIQVALILVVEKYFTFGFFANLALLIGSLVVVLIITSGVIYCPLPFNGKADSE